MTKNLYPNLQKHMCLAPVWGWESNLECLTNYKDILTTSLVVPGSTYNRSIVGNFYSLDDLLGQSAQ